MALRSAACPFDIDFGGFRQLPTRKLSSTVKSIPAPQWQCHGPRALVAEPRDLPPFAGLQTSLVLWPVKHRHGAVSVGPNRLKVVAHNSGMPA